MATFFPANIPLVNYLFYNYTQTSPGPNLPIAGGKVFFRRDDDHTVDKPTYSDVSNPNAPVLNTDPIVLNDAGAFPLFYAEEGLYYIVITGPDGDFNNPIWTFEHVNFEGGAGSGGANVTNYIPNGQFGLHNNLPATDTLEAGEIRAPITDIAYGNWTFERPGDSTATDFVTFERYDEWSANPSANPRYAVRVQCTAPDSGDAFKDIRVKFQNVNRFASATQDYTFAFSGQDNLAGSAPIDLYLIKNFGTGGDAQTETLLTMFNLTPDASDFYFSFNFGTNEGKVIGTQNDDFIQLALRLRTNDANDIQLTDMDLQSGSLIAPIYPATTQRQDVAASLGGGFPVPNPDGSDLYLKPALTDNGWVYDDACIGDIVMESQLSVYVDSLHPSTNRMLPDGAQYLTSGYSPLGIPFARLQSKYWDAAINAPAYGTGDDYLTAYISNLSPATQLRISTNKRGATTNIADGTPATNFTFATAHTGADYGMNAYRTGTASLIAISDFVGTVTPPTAGTSGFTVTDVINQGNRKHVFNVTTIAATTLAGKYFTWVDPGTAYYMWFKVNGSGADPAPGGTGILVNLLSTYTADEVACFVLEAMSGYQISTVVVGAGSTVAAGSNFLVYTVTDNFYVWYTVDGVGTNPSLGGKTGINVSILGVDTAAQVATKTQIAMNSLYFAAPLFQGLFFRAFDPNQFYDVDAAARFGKVATYFGNKIGNIELDEFLLHDHDYGKVNGSPGPVQGGATFDIQSTATSLVGGNETRGVNASVNAAILY